jgi:energy-coupling factor transporter ATPase
VIQISDLHYTYRHQAGAGIHALRGVDLEIAAGTFLAIVGANGSGKTTLARHLNGLLCPARGVVRVDGLDPQDPAQRLDVRARIAMVFQRPEDQIVATTVEDDVAFGPENLGLEPEEIEQRVRWALDTVGMWGSRQRPPHFLSAGQQQRVALAGALAMRPRYLVLDEATAMLDPAGRRAIHSLLGQLHSEGMTIILITHSMEEAALAQRIITLVQGQIRFDGPPHRLFATPDRLTDWGLEAPPAASLANALSHEWPGFPSGLYTTVQLADVLAQMLPRNGHLPSDPPPARERISGPSLLATHNLQHVYLAGTPLATLALAGIDLQVGPGEAIALIGPTGSGKTSLLQHMAGLLRPSGGQVIFEEQDVAVRPIADRPEHSTAGRLPVALLFQRAEEGLFETYVGDDVAFGPRQLGLDQETVRERVRWAMDAAGLPFAAFKDRFTQGLSGGEKRKAALAGILALRPLLMLLDEPTAGLDPRSRQELLATVRRMNQRNDTALVMATHTMEDVVALASRTILLNEGRVVFTGTPRQLFGQPELLAANDLDVPQVTALMHRLRAYGIPVSPGVVSIPEAMAELRRMKCLTL